MGGPAFDEPMGWAAASLSPSFWMPYAVILDGKTLRRALVRKKAGEERGKGRGGRRADAPRENGVDGDLLGAKGHRKSGREVVRSSLGRVVCSTRRGVGQRVSTFLGQTNAQLQSPVPGSARPVSCALGSSPATLEMLMTRPGLMLVAPCSSRGVSLRGGSLDQHCEAGTPGKRAHPEVTGGMRVSALQLSRETRSCQRPCRERRRTVEDGLDVRRHHAVPALRFGKVLVLGSPRRSRVVDELLKERR